MERIKNPQENYRNKVPVYWCSSFEDLKKSKVELIQDMDNWAKNEAGFLTKLKYPFHAKTRPITTREKPTYSQIYIPDIRHAAFESERRSTEPDEIVIWDGINPLNVKLINHHIYNKNAKDIRKDGGMPVEYEEVKDNWTGNIYLMASYSKNDRYSLVGVWKTIKPSQAETERSNSTKKLTPNPSPIR